MFLNDPIVQPKFELNKANLELRVSKNTTVSAKYFDEYGVEKIVLFSWNSTQPQNVTVDANGKIIALKAGSAQIYPKYQTSQVMALILPLLQMIMQWQK